MSDNSYKLLDLSRPGNMSYTRPVKYRYNGGEYPTSSWSSLYVSLCKQLMRDYPETFEIMKYKSVTGKKKPWLVGEELIDRLNRPEMIAEGYYVEAQKSSDELIKSICIVLGECFIAFEKVNIFYVNRGTPNDTEIEAINFNSIYDLKDTKPCELIYFGDRISEKSWRTIYKDICMKLFEDYSNAFERFRRKSIASGRKPILADCENAAAFKVPVEIAPGYFIDTNRDAVTIVRNIKTLLDECRVNYDNITITYLKKWDKSKDEAAEDTR